MPDSHTVQSFSASKENPTCEDDGLMLLIIENWRDTSNFLSATLCLPCIYALDINFWRNKSIPTIFWCSTPNRVLDLHKFENECRLITQDIREPFDVTCSIPCWMMLTTIKLSKISFFRRCDTAMLRSMQIQDPDNRVSDPTDLMSFDSESWWALLSSASALGSEEAALCESKIFKCSPHQTTIDQRIIIASGTGRDLEHADWFIIPLLTPHSNLAWETRPIYAGCAAHVPTSFPGFAHRKPCAVARRALRNTRFFIKNKNHFTLRKA